MNPTILSDPNHLKRVPDRERHARYQPRLNAFEVLLDEINPDGLLERITLGCIKSEKTAREYVDLVNQKRINEALTLLPPNSQEYLGHLF